MKHCEEHAAAIEALLDGQLSPAEELPIRSHLADCPGCQHYLNDLLRMQAHFPTIEDVELPPDFTARVMSAVRSAAPVAHIVAKPKRQGWKLLTPLAACLALVVVLGSQGLLPFAGNSAPPASPGAPRLASGNSALSENAPVAEDGPHQDSLDKSLAPPVLAIEETEGSVVQSDGNSQLTSQPPSAETPITEEEVAPPLPSAFSSGSPQISTASAYVAEVWLSAEEVGTLLVDFLPLDSVEENGVVITRYTLTLPEARQLLVNFPDKTLPEGDLGEVQVLITASK